MLSYKWQIEYSQSKTHLNHLCSTPQRFLQHSLLPLSIYSKFFKATVSTTEEFDATWSFHSSRPHRISDKDIFFLEQIVQLLLHVQFHWVSKGTLVSSWITGFKSVSIPSNCIAFVNKMIRSLVIASVTSLWSTAGNYNDFFSIIVCL